MLQNTCVLLEEDILHIRSGMGASVSLEGLPGFLAAHVLPMRHGSCTAESIWPDSSEMSKEYSPIMSAYTQFVCIPSLVDVGFSES